MQTEKAKSSHFDRKRGFKNQIFPTLNTMGILVLQKTHKEGAQTSGNNGGLTQSLRTNGGLAWHLRSNGGLAWPHKTNGGSHGLIEPMVASLLRIPKVQS